MTTVKAANVIPYASIPNNPHVRLRHAGFGYNTSHGQWWITPSTFARLTEANGVISSGADLNKKDFRAQRFGWWSHLLSWKSCAAQYAIYSCCYQRRLNLRPTDGILKTVITGI